LFGGANDLRYGDSTKRWDISSIPSNSDWAGITRAGLGATGPAPKPARSGKFLLDVEDLGGTPEVADKDGMEVYGRTFVPAKGFRLLLGSARPAGKEKGK
jgi:hypothetical protein